MRAGQIIVAVVAAFCSSLIFNFGNGAGGLEDWSRNWVLSFARPTSPLGVTVVEIDEVSIAEIGTWPWTREVMSKLIQRIGAHHPTVIGIDIVFSQSDVSGTDILARAIEGERVVLAGLLADNSEALKVAPPPWLSRGSGTLLRPWAASGGIWPDEKLQNAAAAVGFASLYPDQTGAIGTVNAVAEVGGQIAPSFALEVLRVGHSATSYVYDGERRTIRVGNYRIPVGIRADFPLTASSADARRARTLSAISVLQGDVSDESIANKVVVVGGSAPETGGLRRMFDGSLVSSAQIQADVIEQVIQNAVPRHPFNKPLTNLVIALLVSLSCALIGLAFAPVVSAFSIVLLLFLFTVATLISSRYTGLLIDLSTPVCAGTLSAVVASMTQAVSFRKKAANLRKNFERHLSPGAVTQLAEKPGNAPLLRRQRTATVLFTDIENFTGSAGGKGPDAIVVILDEYFAGVTKIIYDCGGTIDKIVGDAVHALFNAVTDQPQHADHAVHCAELIIAFSEKFRCREDAKALGLGRTRIGIESGKLLVGEVGGDLRRDFTAHGDAINLAARLEALNKETRTSICIGPTCAALAQRHLSKIGDYDLKGFGVVPVFCPS